MCDKAHLRRASGALAALLLAMAPAMAGAHPWQGGPGAGYAPGYARAAYGRDERNDGGRGDPRDRDHCRGGTGGAILGAIAGGLLGNAVAGDRAAGTLVGGGMGALAGGAIARDC